MKLSWLLASALVSQESNSWAAATSSSIHGTNEDDAHQPPRVLQEGETSGKSLMAEIQHEPDNIGRQLAVAGKYWYVDPVTETCVQDCAEAGANPTCGGLANPWQLVSKFTFADDCCDLKLPWKNRLWCIETSKNPPPPKVAAVPYVGSNEWYVDYPGKKCVQDCNKLAGTPCGGIVEEAWVELHGTVDPGDCCKKKLSWIDTDLCIDLSTPNGPGTFKYYSDFPNARCLRDCNPNVQDPAFICERVTDISKKHYSSISNCCAGDQGWVDKQYCESRSKGIDPFVSPGWVVDYIGLKCVKDSAANTDPSLMIYPSDAWCCDAKLNWLAPKTCEDKSNGIAPTGTDVWYVRWDGPAKCAKDCPEANGQHCGGIKKMWQPGYGINNADKCCDVISWIPRAECEFP